MTCGDGGCYKIHMRTRSINSLRRNASFTQFLLKVRVSRSHLSFCSFSVPATSSPRSRLSAFLRFSLFFAKRRKGCTTMSTQHAEQTEPLQGATVNDCTFGEITREGMHDGLMAAKASCMILLRAKSENLWIESIVHMIRPKAIVLLHADR